MGITEAFLIPILRVLVVNTLICWLFTFLTKGSNEGEPAHETLVISPEELGEDVPDAKGVPGGTPSIPGRPSDRRKSIPGMKYSGVIRDCYNMSHKRRGLAVIINNKTFDESLEMGVRKGTEIDAENLESVLKEIGFMTSVKPDCTADTMMRIVADVAKQNHADEDCFMLVILTHGERDEVYATDTKVQVDDLIEPLKTCRTLAGKPKIIIIQACRGEKLDEGMDVVDARGADLEEDTEPVVYRIPVEADFLIAYASVAGYYAWRNELEGSWFVQALVHVLRENWDRMDLLTMMTRVCKKVALDFESTRTGKQKFLHKKQVPCISSMLTRDLYFDPPTKAE